MIQNLHQQLDLLSEFDGCFCYIWFSEDALLLTVFVIVSFLPSPSGQGPYTPFVWRSKDFVRGLIDLITYLAWISKEWHLFCT